MSGSESHKKDRGFLAEKLYKPSGSMIVLYLAAEQGIDTGGKYAVVCSAHGSIIGEQSLQRAKISMREPVHFCRACYEAGDAGMKSAAERVLERYIVAETADHRPPKALGRKRPKAKSN